MADQLHDMVSGCLSWGRRRSELSDKSVFKKSAKRNAKITAVKDNLRYKLTDKRRQLTTAVKTNSLSSVSSRRIVNRSSIPSLAPN